MIIFLKIKKYNNKLNMIELFIKIILILISILFIIYYDKLFPSLSFNNTKQLETFITLEEAKQDKDNTVYEEGLINSFSDRFPLLVCGLFPKVNCSNKAKFPVHIIKLINGKFGAVFNDGNLYSSDNIKENMWIGPHKNSMPNRFTPLRMITTNPEGNLLMGIGFDNKLYIKNSDKLLDFDVEWQYIPLSINIIYLIHIIDKTSGKIKKIVLDTYGQIRVETNENEFSEPLNMNGQKLIKLYKDKNGYMLGLNNNFRLGTFDDKEWINSKFNNKYKLNYNNFLNDIIYDNDGKLMGLVFNFDENRLDLLKQDDFMSVNNNIEYRSKFYPIDKTRTIKKQLTDKIIISSKIGTGNLLGLYDEENITSPFDNDVSYAYQRQIKQDNDRLRDFCKKRNNQLNSDFINIDLNKQLADNEQKITELKTLINDYKLI